MSAARPAETVSHNISEHAWRANIALQDECGRVASQLRGIGSAMVVLQCAVESTASPPTEETLTGFFELLRETTSRMAQDLSSIAKGISELQNSG